MNYDTLIGRLNHPQPTVISDIAEHLRPKNITTTEPTPLFALEPYDDLFHPTTNRVQYALFHRLALEQFEPIYRMYAPEHEQNLLADTIALTPDSNSDDIAAVANRADQLLQTPGVTEYPTLKLVRAAKVYLRYAARGHKDAIAERRFLSYINGAHASHMGTYLPTSAVIAINWKDQWYDRIRQILSFKDALTADIEVRE